MFIFCFLLANGKMYKLRWSLTCIIDLLQQTLWQSCRTCFLPNSHRCCVGVVEEGSRVEGARKEILEGIIDQKDALQRRIISGASDDWQLHQAHHRPNGLVV